jgi:hypothetical protein
VLNATAQTVCFSLGGTLGTSQPLPMQIGQ